MKIWSFLRWKFNQTTFEDFCWWTGAGLIGAGAGADSKFLLIIGAIFWMCIFSSILIKHYRKEYDEFKQEQNQLFDTIKNSDQK